MRVTANTFPNSLVDELGKLATRQNRLQNQAASGQRIQLPEDDPAAVRQVLDLQAEARSLGQYQKNISQMHDLADASYGQIKAIKTICDRAREIATLADGTKSPEELSSYTIEVTQLIGQAVQFANGKSNGDFLFAGTKSDQPPFVATSDANGLVTGVTYQGNSSTAQNEIGAGVTLSGQTIGANAAGVGPRGLITDSRAGADFFNHLIALQNNLSARNVGAVAATDQPALARDEENFLFHFSTVGVIMERLDTTASLASKQAQSIEVNVSKEVDADLAQTLVRLNQTQTAYQAALQSGARILSQSLLDFLR
jgi:flagellar hook-associated protein 3 FlgL